MKFVKGEDVDGNQDLGFNLAFNDRDKEVVRRYRSNPNDVPWKDMGFVASSIVSAKYLIHELMIMSGVSGINKTNDNNGI
jgi:hypothetical protein